MSEPMIDKAKREFREEYVKRRSSGVSASVDCIVELAAEIFGLLAKPQPADAKSRSQIKREAVMRCEPMQTDFHTGDPDWVPVDKLHEHIARLQAELIEAAQLNDEMKRLFDEVADERDKLQEQLAAAKLTAAQLPWATYFTGSTL